MGAIFWGFSLVEVPKAGLADMVWTLHVCVCPFRIETYFRSIWMVLSVLAV